eukprot:m51a1_g1780 hypothetical protein (686) ;mRNA; f:339956-343217
MTRQPSPRRATPAAREASETRKAPQAKTPSAAAAAAAKSQAADREEKENKSANAAKRQQQPQQPQQPQAQPAQAPPASTSRRRKSKAKKQAEPTAAAAAAAEAPGQQEGSRKHRQAAAGEGAEAAGEQQQRAGARTASGWKTHFTLTFVSFVWYVAVKPVVLYETVLGSGAPEAGAEAEASRSAQLLALGRALAVGHLLMLPALALNFMAPAGSFFSFGLRFTEQQPRTWASELATAVRIFTFDVVAAKLCLGALRHVASPALVLVVGVAGFVAAFGVVCMGSPGLRTWWKLVLGANESRRFLLAGVAWAFVAMPLAAGVLVDVFATRSGLLEGTVADHWDYAVSHPSLSCVIHYVAGLLVVFPCVLVSSDPTGVLMVSKTCRPIFVPPEVLMPRCTCPRCVASGRAGGGGSSALAHPLAWALGVGLVAALVYVPGVALQKFYPYAALDLSSAGSTDYFIVSFAMAQLFGTIFNPAKTAILLDRLVASVESRLERRVTRAYGAFQVAVLCAAFAAVSCVVAVVLGLLALAGLAFLRVTGVVVNCGASHTAAGLLVLLATRVSFGDVRGHVLNALLAVLLGVAMSGVVPALACSSDTGVLWHDFFLGAIPATLLSYTGQLEPLRVSAIKLLTSAAAFVFSLRALANAVTGTEVSPIHTAVLWVATFLALWHLQRRAARKNGAAARD